MLTFLAVTAAFFFVAFLFSCIINDQDGGSFLIVSILYILIITILYGLGVIKRNPPNIAISDEVVYGNTIDSVKNIYYEVGDTLIQYDQVKRR